MFIVTLTLSLGTPQSVLDRASQTSPSVHIWFCLLMVHLEIKKCTEKVISV